MIEKIDYCPLCLDSWKLIYSSETNVEKKYICPNECDLHYIVQNYYDTKYFIYKKLKDFFISEIW
jgi:hypothetical protein